MPQTGDWSAIRWNDSPPLILYIKGRTFLSPVLQARGKAIWLAPLATRHVKEDSELSMPMLQKLTGSLKVAKVKGTLETELKKIERCQLLILDDLFLVPLDVKERPILLEIIEDRHERKSIIITSQYPSSNWYDMVGDPTIADAILDRIIHTAHTIELYGESMRKLRAKKTENLKGKIKLTPITRTLKGQSYRGQGW